MTGVKRLRILGLIGFLSFFPVASLFSQEMTAEQLFSGIREKWGNAQDFQSDLTIGMQMFGSVMKMEGTVWQKEKLFRADMAMPAELVTGTAKAGEPMRMLMVFDGKVMWQSMPMMKMVTKMDFSGVTGELNIPTPRPPYSLPEGLSYRLSEKKRNGSDYYFLETGDITQFIQKAAPAGMMNMPARVPFQNIGVWVNKATMFPELIEFYAQEDTPMMYLEFKNVKINQGLSPDLFVFQVPKDAQVIDMTAAMKAMAEQMKQPPAVTPEATQPSPPK